MGYRVAAGPEIPKQQANGHAKGEGRHQEPRGVGTATGPSGSAYNAADGRLTASREVRGQLCGVDFQWQVAAPKSGFPLGISRSPIRM